MTCWLIITEQVKTVIANSIAFEIATFIKCGTAAKSSSFSCLRQAFKLNALVVFKGYYVSKTIASITGCTYILNSIVFKTQCLVALGDYHTHIVVTVHIAKSDCAIATK